MCFCVVLLYILCYYVLYIFPSEHVPSLTQLWFLILVALVLAIYLSIHSWFWNTHNLIFWHVSNLMLLVYFSTQRMANSVTTLLCANTEIESAWVFLSVQTLIQYIWVLCMCMIWFDLIRVSLSISCRVASHALWQSFDEANAIMTDRWV